MPFDTRRHEWVHDVTARNRFSEGWLECTNCKYIDYVRWSLAEHMLTRPCRHCQKAALQPAVFFPPLWHTTGSRRDGTTVLTENVPAEIAQCPVCSGELVAETTAWRFPTKNIHPEFGPMVPANMDKDWQTHRTDNVGQPLGSHLKVECLNEVRSSILAPTPKHDYKADQWIPILTAVCNWCHAAP